MARAMMWAVECRRTSSASRSLGVRIRSSIGASVAVLERPVEVDDLPAGHRRDRRLGQPLADPLGDLARADPLGIFLDRTIGQLDLDHRRSLLRSVSNILLIRNPRDRFWF